MKSYPRPLLVVVGGFLGAGKTTTILHTAKFLRAGGQRVAIITNDQSSNLVDTVVAGRFAEAVIEIPNGCFCCRFDLFQEALNELARNASPDVVLAEAVGSCTDLAATVYQPLRQLTTDDIGLGPLTVVVDGFRLRELIGGRNRDELPPAVAYLHERQLAEADVILLNKVDLLSSAEVEDVFNDLQRTYPGVTILPISAATSTGLDQWVTRFARSSSTGDRVLDLDYEQYAEAESRLGWLNLAGALRFSNGESGCEWLRVVLEHIVETARSSNLEIAHVKAWLDTDAGYVRGHIVGSDRPPDITTQGSLSGQARLLINGRAPVSPNVLHRWIDGGIQHAGHVTGVELHIESASAFSPARPMPIHRLMPLAH